MKLKVGKKNFASCGKRRKYKSFYTSPFKSGYSMLHCMLSANQWFIMHSFPKYSKIFIDWQLLRKPSPTCSKNNLGYAWDIYHRMKSEELQTGGDLSYSMT